MWQKNVRKTCMEQTYFFQDVIGTQKINVFEQRTHHLCFDKTIYILKQKNVDMSINDFKYYINVMDRKNRKVKTRKVKSRKVKSKSISRNKTRKCHKCPRCGAGKELQEVNGDHCHCKRCGHVY
jgi:hypothetical protein